MSLEIFIMLLRGTPKFESVIGLSSCEMMSWMLLAVFVIVCIILTIFNVRSVVWEKDLKQRLGKLHSSEEWM